MSVEALPTLESLIEGKTAPVEEAPKENQTEAPKNEEGRDRIAEIEREQRHRRELFAAQKRIKELEAKATAGDSSNKTDILNAKNPIKALAKEKGISQDDLIKMALEAMDDDLTTTEKNQELAAMTPDAIAKLVREQIEAENKVKEETKTKQETESKAITDFKAKIAEHSKASAEKYPLVDALNGVDSAFNIINEQYLKDVEEFGEEYAAQNIMQIDDAVKKVNENLAIGVKNALQSKHLRDFIMKTIKEDGQNKETTDQSKDENADQLKEEAFTLSNKSHRASTEPAGKPKFRSNEEELEFLINNYA